MNLTFQILLVGLVACTSAIGGGHSVNNHNQDAFGNYQFSYQVTDDVGAKNYRHETGSHGVKKGSYGLVDIDGRVRHVDYIADHLGFRAKIVSNEPGVAHKDAADASYGGGGVGGGGGY